MTIERGNNLIEIIIKREYTGRDKGYRFQSIDGYTHSIYIDGLFKGLADGDISLKQIRADNHIGFLQKPRIYLIDIFKGHIRVCRKTSVRLNDSTILKCKITIYFIFNPRESTDISALLGYRDFVKTRIKNIDECQTYLTDDDLSEIIGGKVENSIITPFRNITSPSDSIIEVQSAIQNANEHDGIFAMLGLQAISAEIAPEGSNQEEFARMCTELDRKGRIEAKNIQIAGENNLLKMSFIQREYDAFKR